MKEELTEFEKQFEEYMYHPNTDIDIIKNCCKKLLSLARKEFVAEMLKEKENVVYPQITNRRPMCYEDGGTCTNSFHDCINCPKIFSSGGTTTTNFLSNLEEQQ